MRRMVIVTVRMFPGRSVEEKKKLAEAITEDIVRILGPSGATREGAVVIYEEIPETNYAKAGILWSERKTE